VEDLVKAQDVDAFDADGDPAHEALADILDEARQLQSYIGKIFIPIKCQHLRQTKYHSL
jgi:hypothetical protein